jgi:hypothetical protein
MRYDRKSSRWKMEERNPYSLQMQEHTFDVAYHRHAADSGRGGR